MPRFPNDEMPSFSDAQIPRFPDAQFPRYQDSQIPGFLNTHMPRFLVAQIRIRARSDPGIYDAPAFYPYEGFLWPFSGAFPGHFCAISGPFIKILKQWPRNGPEKLSISQTGLTPAPAPDTVNHMGETTGENIFDPDLQEFGLHV